jgi:hypothetical protein
VSGALSTVVGNWLPGVGLLGVARWSVEDVGAIRIDRDGPQISEAFPEPPRATND